MWIGETAPDRHDHSRTLCSIQISGANGWFEEQALPLNPGLVAVIGRKGMGKSALNELVAYAAGAWQDDPLSFIHRSRPHLNGIRIRLNWGDGRIVDHAIAAKGVASTAGEVRYLSQRFVERLCADHQADGDLVKEIEAVIFAHLAPTETLNASSFADLREKRTTTIRQEQRRLVGELQRLHREIHELYKRSLSVPERRARMETLRKERRSIHEQMPQPGTEEEQRIATELQTMRDALAVAIARQAGHKETLLRIDGIREKVQAFRVEMERFWSDIAADLREVGVPEGDRGGFEPAYVGDVNRPLEARRDAITRAMDELEGAENDPARGTIRALQLLVLHLGDRSTADQAKKQRMAELQKRLAAIDLELARIEKEIETIEGAEAEKLGTLRSARRKAYADYFETLRREQAVLAELYRPLEEHLGRAHEEARQVKFGIRWKVDVDAWIERGMQLFDGRKSLPYQTPDALKEAALEHLLPGWQGGPAEEFGAGIDRFLHRFGEDPGSVVPGILKTNFTPVDFFDWIYSVDHIRLNYGLSYQATALENLSPGTKGIVLLILYLAMDNQDTRPLLIDQPDENLDNESIYDLLATYFRSAKQRRQILLITHNPNLVMNTDAEQIVVATCMKGENGLPSMSYVSGAIENAVRPDGIRQRACRVLEGGEKAFHQRERRYALRRA